MLKLLTLILFLSSFTFAQSKRNEKPLQSYQRLSRSLNLSYCTKDFLHKHDQAYSEYINRGLFIPSLIEEDQFDRQSLSDFLPQLQKKITWLKSIQDKLKKDKNHHVEKNKIRSLNDLVFKISQLNLKLETSKNKKKIIRDQKRHLDQLKKGFFNLIDKAYYLTTYSYPVDHEFYRFGSDQSLKEYKDLDNSLEKRILAKRNYNLIRLNRDLLEDGPINQTSHRKDDLQLRTTINTISIRLQEKELTLDEDLIVDLFYVLKQIQRKSYQSKHYHMARFQTWLDRSLELYASYKNLLNTKPLAIATKLKRYNEKKDRLMDLVYSTQAKAYEFWSKQNYFSKSLFVLNNILIHEVGP